MALYDVSIPAVDQIPVVDLTGRTSYSFDSSNGYDPILHYAWRVTLEDVVPSAARDLWVRFSGVSTASYATLQQFLKLNASAGDFLNAANIAFALTVSNINPGGTGATGFVDITAGTQSGNARIYSTQFYQDSGPQITRATLEGIFLNAGVVTSFDFLLSGAGTFTRGTLRIEAKRRA